MNDHIYFEDENGIRLIAIINYEGGKCNWDYWLNNWKTEYYNSKVKRSYFETLEDYLIYQIEESCEKCDSLHLVYPNRSGFCNNYYIEDDI